MVLRVHYANTGFTRTDTVELEVFVSSSTISVFVKDVVFQDCILNFMPPLFSGIQLDVQNKKIACFRFPINAIKKQQIPIHQWFSVVSEWGPELLKENGDDLVGIRKRIVYNCKKVMTLICTTARKKKSSPKDCLPRHTTCTRVVISNLSDLVTT